MTSNAPPQRKAVPAHNDITNRPRSGSIRRIAFVGRGMPVATVTMPGAASVSEEDAGLDTGKQTTCCQVIDKLSFQGVSR